MVWGCYRDGEGRKKFSDFPPQEHFQGRPEHLRHASEDERVLAQADGREMLGLSSMLQDPDRKAIGSQFTDLTDTPTPEQARTPTVEVEDFWLKKGEYMCRIHRQPRNTLFWPSENDPALEGMWFENWRKTIRSDTKECLVHQPLSNPESKEACWGDEPWKGESQFRLKPRRGLSHTVPVEASPPVATTTGEDETKPTVESDRPQESSATEESRPRVREPYERPVSEPYWQTSGPVRVRQHVKNPPTFLIRPVGTQIDDLQEILTENHGTKRSHSPEGRAASSSKSQKTEDHSCLFAELASENGPAQSVEVLIASFLQKKLQKELHHSKNPPQLQEKIDASKIVEWTTLRDEKKTLAVIPPHEARRIRANRSDRIMTSRFVIVEKHEDGDSKIKSRWCLRGHHDPDLFTKVLAGKCHSPTLSQFGRSLILQMIVSNRWKMHLGDIKGAFLEANVRQVLGNIYGANDAPHEWYCEFNRVALEAGFVRSKFDNCLYLYCYNQKNQLEGILGAHVDDTITGGSGTTYTKAVEMLRSRFPFRKWRSGTGEFLGTIYTKKLDTMEISFQQKEYAEHITPIRVSKDRIKKPWLPANPQEISALRAVNGALSWLSTQSRPDLAVQTSTSQQCFPNPTVQDLLQANQAVRRARQQSDLKIQVPYIPLDQLTLCFWSDAAFANSTELRTQGGWLVAFT